jgi:hypothetical protein
MNFVFTVCGSAAGEVCPVRSAQPIKAYQGAEDPAAVVGTDNEKQGSFNEAFLILKRRIELFASLPIDKLDRLALSNEVKRIGAA